MNIGAVAADDDCGDGAAADAAVDDDDDEKDDVDDIKADEGGVNEPLFTDAVAVAIGHDAVDIDDCMVELRPFGFCCCFSFSGITIWLG